MVNTRDKDMFNSKISNLYICKKNPIHQNGNKHMVNYELDPEKEPLRVFLDKPQKM